VQLLPSIALFSNPKVWIYKFCAKPATPNLIVALRQAVGFRFSGGFIQ